MKRNKNLQFPDFISPADPESFANYTVRVRFPKIIERVIEKNNLHREKPCKERERLTQLKEEITVGRLIDPFKTNANLIDINMFEKAELSTWKDYISRYKGKNWFEIPWYFGEAFFYLRILIAFGYYNRNSKLYKRDPFKPIKEEEIFSPGGAIETAGKITRFLIQSEEKNYPTEETIRELVLFSLWGNRIDLSYDNVAQQAKRKGMKEKAGLLIINHTTSLAEEILRSQEIHFILDNAGTELISDLFLAYFLLNSHRTPKKRGKISRIPVARVIFHAKKSPFFVSDTTAEDIIHTLHILKQSKETKLHEFAKELEALIETNKLIIKEHYFWNGPCGFPEMPNTIREQLYHSNLTIIKGDANYRRLLSDRKWDFTTPIEEITNYFPSQFAILRTMKSEIIVGITHEKIKQLYLEDSSWLINGRRGIIQIVKKSGEREKKPLTTRKI